ncbi:MAG: hypothetical protein LPK79_06055 [Bacteroidota bacterium]|nr:hypothetical protein [Bacteroidota bacterium]
MKWLLSIAFLCLWKISSAQIVITRTDTLPDNERLALNSDWKTRYAIGLDIPPFMIGAMQFSLEIAPIDKISFKIGGGPTWSDYNQMARWENSFYSDLGVWDVWKSRMGWNATAQIRYYTRIDAMSSNGMYYGIGMNHFQYSYQRSFEHLEDIAQTNYSITAYYLEIGGNKYINPRFHFNLGIRVGAQVLRRNGLKEERQNSLPYDYELVEDHYLEVMFYPSPVLRIGYRLD